MPAYKLTASVVARLPVPASGRVEHRDTEVRGYFVRVHADGKRVACIRYRTASGERRYTIGPIDATQTAHQAREEARRRLAQVRQGGDPSGDQRQERAAESFADAADRWLEEHAEATCKPRTATRYRELVGHLASHLKQKMAAITRADVERAHRAIGVVRIERIKNERTGKIRSVKHGGPGTANRALLCASAIFNWAEGQSIRPQGSNPARGIKRFGEKPGGHFYTAAELARIDAVLTNAEHIEHGNAGSFGAATVLAIRLLMLTGARLSEVTNLRWSEVDLERGMLVLVDSKTGRSVRPMTPQAIALLETLKRARDKATAFVCPSSSATPLDPTRVDRAWRSVRRLADLPAGSRLHDLRHTAGSIALEAGVPLPVVSKMLGHRSVSTTARIYSHALDATQHLAKFGAAFASKLAQGAEANREDDARVVAMPRAKRKVAKR